MWAQVMRDDTKRLLATRRRAKARLRHAGNAGDVIAQAHELVFVIRLLASKFVDL